MIILSHHIHLLRDSLESLDQAAPQLTRAELGELHRAFRAQAHLESKPFVDET